MKKIIYSSIFALFAVNSFGQSVTILPSNTTNKATSGNNISVFDNTDNIGVSSRRLNGTIASPTPVTSGQDILRINAGGYYSTTGSDNQSSIRFTSTENWGLFNSGAKMSFWTTPNGDYQQQERMVISHDGKVGIKASLDVLGTNSASVGTFRNTTTGSYIQFFQNTSTYTGYLGTYNDAANKSVELGTGLFNGTGSVFLSTNSIPRVTVTPLGYTKLGDNAATPAIKMMKLTGGFSTGACTSFTHGLTQSKIIAVDVLVNSNLGNYVHPAYEAPYKFNYFVSSTTIEVCPVSGQSGSLSTAANATKIVITYEE